MWWLLAVAGLYFCRGQIAKFVAPLVPDLPPQKTTFYGHLVTLVAGLLYILPLEVVVPPFRVLKRLAYLVSMWATAATLVFTIKANYGAPPIPQGVSFSNWKETVVPVLQPWLMKAMNGADFSFLFLVLIFLPANPSVWALLILGRRSLWAVSTYCSKNTPESRFWKAFAPQWEKLKAMDKEVLASSALAEILLGLWLTVSLALPTRQIITCILYWNYLKTRYQVPRSHEVHLQAWRRLGSQVEPILKAVPVLQKPLDMAKGWFQPAYPMGQTH